MARKGFGNRSVPDLGDRTSRYCILDEAGEVVSEGQATTTAGLSSLLAGMPPSRVALEVGTHSPWVSRHIASLGHEVIVANPHKVKLITPSARKNDRIDARQLARLARVDPKLLSPIRHRGAQAQADLAVIRARAELLEARTALINSARGLVKPRVPEPPGPLSRAMDFREGRAFVQGSRSRANTARSGQIPSLPKRFLR